LLGVGWRLKCDCYLKFSGKISINSPHARRVYGEEVQINSCLLCLKVKGSGFVPIGEESRLWMSTGTDKPPQIRETIKVMKKGRINLFEIDEYSITV